MKYKVEAHFFDTQEVHDFAIVDTYEEAADLACNWQAYYDDEYEWTGDEVIVAIYEIDERSLVDG